MKASPDEDVISLPVTGEEPDYDDSLVHVCALRKNWNSLTTLTLVIHSSRKLLLRAIVTCNLTGIEIISVQSALSGEFFPEVTFLVEHNKGYTLQIIVKKTSQVQTTSNTNRT